MKFYRSIILGVFLLLSVQFAHAQTCKEIFSNNRSQAEDAALQEVRAIWLNFARKTIAHSDFKYLADLIFKKNSPQERQDLLKKAKSYRQTIYQRLLTAGFAKKTALGLAQTAYARKILELFFEFKTQVKNVDEQLLGPKLTLIERKKDYDFKFDELQSMFSSLESSWPNLIKRVVYYAGGSLLKAKRAILIAGGRFRESYYWDTVFGVFGLAATNRVQLVVDQMKNFIDDINEYGFIFNGRRTYYNTRSQPPMITVLVEKAFESSRAWSKKERLKVDKYILNEALPALEKDYHEFWMKRRYDPHTGLNFHFDDGGNRPRPERHSKDDDYKLGETPLDTKAKAEEGTDFNSIDGGRTSKMAQVQLNAFMFKYELDLAWLYTMKAIQATPGGKRRSLEEDAARYKRAAEKRRQAINKYLRSVDGLYRTYDREREQQVEAVSGEIFALLFTKVLTQDQANEMIPKALRLLEKDGGIAASTIFNSTKQWDGNHGWAPYQIMAIQGLKNYGYHAEADRLAKKWLKTVLNVFNRTGQFFEKYDVETMDLPHSDNTKYPNQVGFLWTNSSIVWILESLGYTFNN